MCWTKNQGYFKDEKETIWNIIGVDGEGEWAASGHAAQGFTGGLRGEAKISSLLCEGRLRGFCFPAGGTGASQTYDLFEPLAGASSDSPGQIVGDWVRPTKDRTHLNYNK